MKERIAIIDGLRTPMGKMGGSLAKMQADILGSYAIRELYTRFCDLDLDLSEVIIGNVAQPAHAANIARVAALRAQIPQNVPAFTVHRNCASGIEALTSASCKLLTGKGEIILAGGIESMSNIPLLFRAEFKDFLEALMRAKTIPQKLQTLAKFRPSFLKPIIGLKLGLTDPVCNLIMGDTAENLAKDWSISRKEQDEFASQSHNRAETAIKNNVFAEEIIPIPYNQNGDMLFNDEGVRNGQNTKDLAKLKPFFDRQNGTVTAGNSSQITDGAAAMILMTESKAKKLKLKPLGYIKDFTFAALDPSRMGLGPAYAISQILTANKKKLKDIDLFEINEAFASQVIACLKAMDSKKFCTEKLGLKDKIGLIDQNILNIDGGAIAVGHPVGMTGTRIVLHLLHAMKKFNKQTSIASLCIGGGQGAAVLLERE